MGSLQESTHFPSENQCLQKLPPCHHAWLLRAHRSFWLHVLEAQMKAALTKWHGVWITRMMHWWDSWKKTNVITACWPMEYNDFYPSRASPLSLFCYLWLFSPHMFPLFSYQSPLFHRHWVFTCIPTPRTQYLRFSIPVFWPGLCKNALILNIATRSMKCTKITLIQEFTLWGNSLIFLQSFLSAFKIREEMIFAC